MKNPANPQRIRSRAKPKTKRSSPTTKSGTTSTSSPETGAETRLRAAAGKSAKPTKSRNSKQPVVLLSGGNPQIAKGDGDAPVQAYIAAIPEWKHALGQRLDTLITRAVPDVRKAVKWNSPFYGIEGQGWFL